MNEQEAGHSGSDKRTENESIPDEGEARDLEASGTENARKGLEGQAGDALAWLEGPAFDSPIEEMPTLQWPDVEAEASLAADEEETAGVGKTGDKAKTKDGETGQEADQLEDAMQWLEELAQEQGTPLDEMPTLISSGNREPYGTADDAEAQDFIELGATTPPPQLDSDPMAWLEQLAIDQNSPLEDLPSVADRLLASEIVSQNSLEENEQLEPLTSMPVELDAALKYLEEQAAAQGIDLDEINIDAEDMEGATKEDLLSLDNIAKTAAAAAVINQIAGSSSKDEETEEGHELPPLTAESVDEELEEPLESEEGDDPASLAAESVDEELEEPRESAEVDSALPSGAQDDEVVSGPDQISTEQSEDEAEEGDASLAKKAAVVSASTLARSAGDEEQERAAAVEREVVDAPHADILDEMPDDPDEALAWMGAMSDEVETETAESTVKEEPVSAKVSKADDDQGDSLLKKAAAVVGAAKLATSLFDGDEDVEEPSESVADAEVQVMDADILQGMPDDPDEAMAWMAGLAAKEAADKSEARADEQPQEAAREVPSEGEEDKLEKARLALGTGDVAGAAKHYRAQLEGDSGRPELIEELEKVVEEQPNEPELLNVLGDAYMKEGHMQKALEVYSKGFDH